MFGCLIYMVCLELRFSILHLAPSATIRLKAIYLGHITKHHPMLVLDCSELIAFDKIQLATLIHGCKQWLLPLFKCPKTWFTKSMTHCVGVYYYIQVLRYSSAHFDNIIHSMNHIGLYAHLPFSRNEAPKGCSSCKLEVRNMFSTFSRTCRLKNKSYSNYLHLSYVLGPFTTRL